MFGVVLTCVLTSGAKSLDPKKEHELRMKREIVRQKLEK